MNVNEKIMALETVTGYPVRHDIYDGEEDKYITFTYEDERSAMHGDNDELATTAYLQVSLYTPENFDYFEDKKKIKRELKRQGFIVETVQSWLENSAKKGTKRVRHIVFIVNITEMEE